MCVYVHSIGVFIPSAFRYHCMCVCIYTSQEEWKLFYEEFAMSDSETIKVSENLSSQ